MIAFARLDELVDQPGEQLVDQLHPPAGELQRVLAEVEQVDQRIDGAGAVGVFIGGVAEPRLGAAQGDLPQRQPLRLPCRRAAAGSRTRIAQ